MIPRPLFVVALLLPSAVVRAEDMKAKLQPIYDQMAQATLRKDAAGWRKLTRRYFAADFAYVQKGGRKLTTDQMLGELAALAAKVGPFTRSSIRIESAKGNAKSATLVVVSDWATTFKDGRGKLHKIEGSERTEDGWTSVGMAWKLSRIATKEATAKMDGKAMRM